MNFSAWAIRRPLPALMIFFVLCVAGLWGFHKLPVARFPDHGRSGTLRLEVWGAGKRVVIDGVANPRL